MILRPERGEVRVEVGGRIRRMGVTSQQMVAIRGSRHLGNRSKAGPGWGLGHCQLVFRLFCRFGPDLDCGGLNQDHTTTDRYRERTLARHVRQG